MTKLFAIFKRGWIALPYAWLCLFFAIPFLYLVKISFSESMIGIPPIKHILEIDHLSLTLSLNFTHYARIFKDSFYLTGFVSSLSMAVTATFCCLILGYGMAYGLTRLPQRHKIVGLMIIMIPFSTSFLIRVYAWITLLSQEGIINHFLMKMGIISFPLPLLYNDFSVLLGLVYCYLPFMILPIYSILEKIEPAYLEVSFDLGATPYKTFRQVTFPLSIPGMIAGCILVFVPVMGEFVIPELLGGPDTFMIGRILWMEFFNNRDWALASALAVILLILFVIPIIVLQRFEERKQS